MKMNIGKFTGQLDSIMQRLTQATVAAVLAPGKDGCGSFEMLLATTRLNADQQARFRLCSPERTLKMF